MSSFLRRASELTAILAVLAASACQEDVNVVVVEGELSTDPMVDFKEVQKGIEKQFELEVKNVGEGPLAIDRIELGDGFTAAQYDFKIVDFREVKDGFTLGPNQTRVLVIAFRPFDAMEDPVRSEFKFFMECDEQGKCETFTVAVQGKGVDIGLVVDPNPVEFGKVLVGSERVVDVQITNALPVAVDVITKVNASGKADIRNRNGQGRFELISPITASGSLLPEGTLLEKGQSITVQVRYIPDPGEPGRLDEGRWIAANCGDPLCEVPVKLTGEGTNAAITCTPESLLFDNVNPQATVDRETTCVNEASETVTVTGWHMEPGSHSTIAVENYTGVPASLAPAGQFNVRVTFSPTESDVGVDLEGALIVTGRNPRANRDLDPTRIPVQASAGGPDIQVSPSDVNFGQIAIGAPGNRRILVENTGWSDLNVTGINADAAGTGLFTADRNAFTVRPGASEVVQLTFAPTTAVSAVSEVLILSDDSDESEVRIPLRGEGLALPPCAYRLQPETINFGIVQVLRPTSQALRIENVGSTDCLVNDIDLAPGSSAGLRLVDGRETGIIIPPNDVKTVLVEYMPQAPGVHTGHLTFYISDPTAPNQEVEIRGVGSESALLISPNEVDFGLIGVNCSTRDRVITIYNTGSSATRIVRIEVPAGVSPEFEISNLPNGVPAPPGAGASIPPGQSIEFSVRYRARDLGPDTGFFHIFEANQTDPYVVPLYGGGAEDPINEDAFTQLETPEVDILFVIDNSCSMSDEQASLTSNFQSFIQFADAQALDYQIAIVSTDVDGGRNGCPSPANPQRPMGAEQGSCGYFADGNGDGTAQNQDWRVIAPSEQPSPEIAFGAIATQGINGSGTERGLEAAYMALSSPLITGWNSGFLRQDAYLALIFVSDEEDQSPNSVDFYINFFRAIKGFRNSNLFSASAIVGDVPSGCGGSHADPGARYVEVAQRTGGIFESICTTDWATALENLGLSVFGYKSRFFLSNQPIQGTVEVLVDGVPVQATADNGQIRWTYEGSTNSVNFQPLAIPEPGAEIIIRYRAECL